MDHFTIELGSSYLKEEESMMQVVLRRLIIILTYERVFRWCSAQQNVQTIDNPPHLWSGRQRGIYEGQ